MMRRLLFCFVFSCYFGLAGMHAQQTVSFFEEHIDFAIDHSYFTINGIYSFGNSSDHIVTQKIIFPFAKNDALADSIRVFDLNRHKKIQFYRLKDAIAFDITLNPKDTLDVNIGYRQGRLAKNTYIITSTKFWGKPLKKAFYTLTVPKDMNVASFSYKPDSVTSSKKADIYYWGKYDFLPEAEFDFVVK